MNHHVRWRRCARGTHIGLILTFLLTLYSLCGCALTARTPPAGSVTYGQSAASTPSSPTATPKGGVIPQGAATLGGSVFAFDKKFGANNCCFENGWTYQGPYSQMWTGVYTGGADSLRKVDERSTQRVVGVENGGAMYA